MAPGYPVCHFFFWNSCKIHTYIYMYWKTCVLTSLCSRVPNRGELGSKTYVRYTAPPGKGEPVEDRHDRNFPEKGHHASSTRIFFGLLVPCEGPRGHENFHHSTVLELVLDGVHIVRVGLLEESLEVVCRWYSKTI
jgi:hypothetical protein